MMLSIIIPILNEEKILSINSSQFISLSNTAELIFVDGGSSDKSIDIASKSGKVIEGSKGRAVQMNLGADLSAGDILLFLHADSCITPQTIKTIKEKITDHGFIGGCLSQRIDKPGCLFRVIEGFGNMRARITRVFYGDQGIFVAKKIFFQIGGFPEAPIMEDVMFTKKLKKKGRTVVLDNNILVSPRRWEKHGIFRSVLRYSLLNILFWMRVPLDRIKRLYDDIR